MTQLKISKISYKQRTYPSPKIRKKQQRRTTATKDKTPTSKIVGVFISCILEAKPTAERGRLFSFIHSPKTLTLGILRGK